MTDISFTMHFCFWKILSSSIKHENVQLFGKDINTIYLGKLAMQVGHLSKDNKCSLDEISFLNKVFTLTFPHNEIF